MKIQILSDRFNSMEIEVDKWIKDNPNATVKKVDPFGNNIEGKRWLVWYC